jgi:lysophospholipase L1-like esterase
VHVGLDGQENANSDNIDIPKNSGWAWSNGSHTINVTSTGEHTINVWMREDGTRFDKIVLTTDSSFTPSGSGPAESETNLCQPTPSVTISSPEAMHIQTSSNLTIRANACLDAAQHAGWAVRFVLDENSPQEQEIIDQSAPFEVTISGVGKGEHVVKAQLVDENDAPQAGSNNVDEVQSVGVGDYAVAMGDSITAGTGDDDPSDDTCPDGRVTGGGYPPILCAELNSRDQTAGGGTFPHFIANEGVGGDKSVDGVALVSAVLANHPEAQRVIIWYGMNDARPSNPTMSGLGRNPGDGGYPGSFKHNLQQMIDAVVGAGKEPVLAEIIVALGDCSNPAQCATYPDPDQGDRSVNIQEFNAVIQEIRSELNSDGDPSNDIQVVPPPFYGMFNPNNPQGHTGEYADHIHPNGQGYRTTVTEQGGWVDALCPSCP